MKAPGRSRVSTQLLTEMVTRSSKWILNSQFRKVALGEQASWGVGGGDDKGAGAGVTDGSASAAAPGSQAHPEAAAMLSAIFPSAAAAHIAHALAMYDGSVDLAANWLSENPSPPAAERTMPPAREPPAGDHRATATAAVVTALNHVLGKSPAASTFWHLLLPVCLRVKFGSHQPALTAEEASGVSAVTDAVALVCQYRACG